MGERQEQTTTYVIPSTNCTADKHRLTWCTESQGSGSVTILEAFRVLLTDSRVASGQAANTIEFHWYAAEEGGLLGSQAVFTNYKNSGKVVKAMLQQDMTGYVKPGTKEAVGVITDYVDAGLTSFIKKVVTAVSRIVLSLTAHS